MDEDFNAAFALGAFFKDCGLYDHALKYYLGIIEIEPVYIYCYMWIAYVYSKLGQLENAAMYCRKLAELAPEDPQKSSNLFFYARILFDMKMFDQFNEIRLNLEKVDSVPANRKKYLKALYHIMNDQKEPALKTYAESDSSGYAIGLKMRLYDHFKMNDEFIKLLQEDFARNKKIEHSEYLWLKSTALFNNLRSDPRFNEILAKHKQLYEENLRKYPDVE